MSPHTWHHTPEGLALRLGSGTEALPEPLEEWLTGEAGIGTTADAAADLIRLEAHFTQLVRELQRNLDVAEIGVAATRTMVAEASERRSRVRREAGSLLDEAIRYHTETAEQLGDVQTLVELVREFVIGIDPPGGRLRHTADGWLRDSDPPAHVVVFVDVDAFLAADSRRTHTASWGGTVLAGIEQFGTSWRRDPDDQPLTSTGDEPGTWTLGYLPATAELYAIRRLVDQPHQVWVLGHFSNPTEVATALAPATPLMGYPNSLILAADLAHRAQLAAAFPASGDTG